MATPLRRAAEVGDDNLECRQLRNHTGHVDGIANYAITYIGREPDGRPAPLTVTADAKCRAYGGANPTLTYKAAAPASSTATAVGRAGDFGDDSLQRRRLRHHTGDVDGLGQLRDELYRA